MTRRRFGPGRALAAAAVLIVARAPLCAAQAAASVPPAEADTLHLDLAQAIGRALAENPGLLAASQRARAADRAAAEAFRQHFGEVQALALASRYQDAQVLVPMSQPLLAGGIANMPFAQEQLHYGLTFELPLFLGGKLIAGSQLARLNADEAGQLLTGTRWQVRTNVTTLYAATEVLTATAAAYEQEVASLEQTHARIALMTQQGKRPQVDLLKATDALEEARAQLADATAEQTHTRLLLLAVLDYPADQPVELDSLPDALPSLPADTVNWAALVQAASPVAAAELRVRQASSSKRLAVADFLPKLSLRGDLLENTGNGLGRTLETWDLTLAASLPVFAGGRRVAAYQRAAADERAASLALRQTRLTQQAEMQGALARFRAATEALDAARIRVTAADEAARIETVRYEQGAGTIEDLVIARARAAGAQAFLAKSKGDVLGAAARINALVETEVVR